ncbi:restriction endonuclease subunit S [Sulfuricurvum sp.]|uniref:restriction endonuclease subunit S n=1 Tax=Sulfuricurvum sp. TaxID=2025608 RepID=UPI002622A783|nr:restriction endonuclease subunit S [Sulfuricurvum sp.]MDD3597460.1 restriction endonuclease subunit S [Sulfuricurvum sp.]
MRANIEKDGKLLFIKQVKLTAICQPKQHKTISKKDMSDNGKYLLYGANGVIGRSDKYTHEHEALLITCRGATCGTLNISKPMSYVNGNAMALDKLSDQVSLKFLYYYLLQRRLDDVITGSAQPQITKENLEKVNVSLPSLSKQKEIAQTLDKAQELIEHRKASIQKLDELAQSIFIDMFGDPVENPKGWVKDKAEKHIQLLTGYPFKSQNYSTDENDIKLCGGLIITPHGIDWKKANHWNKNDVDELGKYWLKVDDIVMAMDRPWISSGFKIYQIRNTDPEALLVQRTARIRPIKLNCKFLYFLYKEPSFAMQSKITETTVPHISPKDIQNYNIILPPIDLQNKFAQTIEKIEAQKSLYEAELTKLQAAFDALMAQSFEG